MNEPLPAGELQVLWKRMPSVLLGIMAVALFGVALLLGKVYLMALLGLAVIAVIINDYRNGLWLLLLISPTIIVHEKNYGDYKFVLACLITLQWLVTRMRSGAKNGSLWHHPMMMPVLLFSLSATASTLLSVDPGQSLKPLLKVMGNLIFVFIFADAARSKESVLFFFQALLVAAGLEAVIGIIEFGYVMHLNGWLFLHRSQATFVHPNVFGRYLGNIMVFLIALLLYDPQKRPVRVVWLGLLAAGLLLSFSRSSMLGLIISVSALFMVRFFPRWEKPVFVGLMTALAIAFAVFGGWLTWHTQHRPEISALDGIQDTMVKPETLKEDWFDESFFRKVLRDDIWCTAMKMVLDKPLLGHGLGMLAVVSGNYIPFTVGNIHDMLAKWKETGDLLPPLIVNGHNMALDITAQIGLVGLAIVCLLYLALFKHMGQYWQARGRTDYLRDGMIAGGLACVIYDAIVGFFEPANIFGPGSIGFVFIFMIAIVINLGEVNDDKTMD